MKKTTKSHKNAPSRVKVATKKNSLIVPIVLLVIVALLAVIFYAVNQKALGILGIILALATFAIVCWKGWNSYIGALVAACIAMIFNMMPILDTVKENFIPGVCGSFKSLFLVFFFGTLLGKLYSDTGAAASIATALDKQFSKFRKLGPTFKDLSIILIVDIIGLGCCYGGINCVVLPVALYPLVVSLMEKANIPKRFVIGIVLQALATAGMTGPGTPQVQNLIPMEYLGTTARAALIPGLICCAFILVVNTIYLLTAIKHARLRGEKFAYGPKDKKFDANAKLPNPLVSAVPLILIFVLFNFVKFGIELSLFIGTVVAIILLYKQFKSFDELRASLNSGALDSLGFVLAINFMSGFGSVIKATPAFQVFIDMLPNFHGNALVVGLATTVLFCALTGSASGGLTIALPIIAPIYASLCNPAALHRCMSLASSSLDTLPFNGGFLSFLGIADLKHKDAYPPVCVTTVIVTLLGAVLCVILCLLFPGIVNIGN